MEHRLSKRVPIHCRVDLEFLNIRVRQCYLVNLSRDGAYVRTRGLPLPRGRCIELLLRAEGWTESPCRVRGVVVHSSSRGAGLLLTGVDEEAAALIDQVHAA